MSATPRRRPLAPRPAVDEWGMYDPEQAGLAALFARLDARSRPAPPTDAPADTPADGPGLALADRRAPSTPGGD
ncbi:MAG: hypothetical protein AB7H88_14715 [Vicinamibacterales bacterium]